jgi:hypothetical protein
MAIIRLIGQLLTIFSFLLNLRGESNKKKAEEKKKVGDKLVEALAETNPKRRDSYLVGVIDDIGRLRK